MGENYCLDPRECLLCEDRVVGGVCVRCGARYEGYRAGAHDEAKRSGRLKRAVDRSGLNEQKTKAMKSKKYLTRLPAAGLGAMLVFLCCGALLAARLPQADVLLAKAVPAKAVPGKAVVPLPNLELTPGDTNPMLTKERICDPSFRTGPFRNVSLAEKKEVFRRYGIDWANHHGYEVDHDVSLELGGSNTLENLWPQAYEPKPGAKEKDTLENLLHRCVCDGKISLEEAQERIAEDWYALYVETQDGTACPAAQGAVDGPSGG